MTHHELLKQKRQYENHLEELWKSALLRSRILPTTIP